MWFFIGSHTIGDSRCTSFRQRLYNQTGNGKSDFTLDQNYAAQLRTRCPRSGGDQNLFVLDFVTPVKFDNFYYKNLLANKGLLNSDEVLLTKNQVSAGLVKKYAERNDIFFDQFAKSMVKMGNITPLTGSRGEIRKHCRKINTWWSNGIVMQRMWKLHLHFVDLFFLSFIYLFCHIIKQDRESTDLFHDELMKLLAACPDHELRHLVKLCVWMNFMK